MFKLTIVTPEKKLVFNQEAESILIPAFRGELNILPGHAPIMTTLEAGVLRWKIKGSESYDRAAISWGYCEVSPEGVNVLADIAHLPSEIVLEEQEGIIKSSLEKLATQSLDDTTWAQTNRELGLAKASIEALPLVKKQH